jgi:hypothetical protein
LDVLARYDERPVNAGDFGEVEATPAHRRASAWAAVNRNVTVPCGSATSAFGLPFETATAQSTLAPRMAL